MDLSGRGSEERFKAYVEALIGVIGHADRAAPLRDYCSGLLLPVARKSVEPLAAATAPARVSAQHQSLLHFVGQAGWSDEAVLAKVRDLVLPTIERSGPIRAWIVDDTAIPKKGKHSVGVARQYCGQLGKQENCQVAVTLSVANDAGSLPLAYRLYLPENWAKDPERRRKAGIPEAVGFQTKPGIALDQIRAAKAAGVAPGVVLADAGYGNETSFRSGVTDLGLAYVMGVQGSTSVWAPGTGPLPPKAWSGRGRPPSALRRDQDHQPRSVKALAESLETGAWTTVTWRDGSNTPLSSRFAALRIRPAHRDHQRATPRLVEWLLIEWPEDEAEPSKYWLSTLPEDIGLAGLVDIAKLRWRIERDYQDLKQEVGLGHYEGRGWRGFHHHATLCIAAYGFLISERQTTPPSGPDAAAWRQKPALPEGYRPRGAADPTRTARPQLDRHSATTPHGGDRQGPKPMSMLQHAPKKHEPKKLMTQ